MKTTPLPSVKQMEDYVQEKLIVPEGILFKMWNTDFYHILTQDRNQAYTSLVEGIEELKRPRPTNVPSQNWTEEENINDILDDILENVVKPLYGKE